MGQRLVVSIYGPEDTKDGEPIAKIYYHWNAYTIPTLETLAELAGVLDGTKTNHEAIVALANHLNETYGGVDDDTELTYMQEEFPEAKYDFYDKRDRNYGLMAVTPEGQARLQDWSEGDADIDLAERNVTDNVTWQFDGSDEEAKEQIEEISGYALPDNIDDLPSLPSVDKLGFDEIGDVLATYKETDCGMYGGVFRYDGTNYLGVLVE